MNQIKKIYDNFINEMEKVSKFYTITTLSYAMSSHALKDTDKEKLNQIRRDIVKKSMKMDRVSYTRASVSIAEGETDVLCEWVTLEEYAEREKIQFEQVIEEAETGKYGEIHVADGMKYIIWPPAYQSEKDKPEYPKKIYAVKVNQAVSFPVVVSDDSPEQIAALLGDYKEFNAELERVGQLIHEQCYLSYWTIFEVFVKKLALALFELYPEIVFKNKKYGNDTIKYIDIFNTSEQFTSISSLKTYIMESIVETNGKVDNESIHSIINFIKECYMSNGVDPYKAQYVYNGEKIETSYVGLIQIKALRNSLVHDNGLITRKLLDEVDYLEQTVGESLIITDDMLSTEFYALEAIAENIFSLAQKEMTMYEGDQNQGKR